MTNTLHLTFLFWIILVTVTAMQRAVPLSYSHWCPAIEMKRISCVSPIGALKNQGTGNGILRRVYRWKKQFVLRCCPGFMGPNCQQACFSCRGYAALREKLTNIERLVHEKANECSRRQTLDPERRVRPTVSFLTGSGHDKTQYGTMGYQPLPQRESGHAFLREATIGTFKRPIVVENPPELVVALAGFPREEHLAEGEINDTSALQNDQRSNDSTQESPNALTISASGKPLNQLDDSKDQKLWSQGWTIEPNNVKAGFTSSQTAEVENVWKHWDEEFQIRLSTLERQVLELETKLSALSSVLASVTSLNDKIGEINRRVASLETNSEIPDPTVQSKFDGKPDDKLKDRTSSKTKTDHSGSRRKKKGFKKYNAKKKRNDTRAKFGDHSSDVDPFHDRNSIPNQQSNQKSTKYKESKSMKNSRPNNVKDRFSTSQNSGQPPANLSFNRTKSRLKFKTSTSSMKRNNSLSFNATAGSDSDDAQPNTNVPSNSSSPCANLCQGQAVPSRPHPPPLPDKEIVEKVFTSNPHLVDALGQGHKTFHRHLKAVLNRNSTNSSDAEKETQTRSAFPSSSSASRHGNNTPDDSSLIPNEGFTGKIVFGDQSQNSNEGSHLHSQLNSKGHEGEQTDFQLQRGNMANSDHDENENARDNKIGHYTASRSNAFPMSVSTSCILNVLCFSVTMMFMR